MSMPSPIPASPIPQTTQGLPLQSPMPTLYVAVRTWPAGHGGGRYNCLGAYVAQRKFKSGDQVVFKLLGTRDAEELEKLRMVEDEAARLMLYGFSDSTQHEDEYTCLCDLVDTWSEARDARIAFEAKIGGGT